MSVPGDLDAQMDTHSQSPTAATCPYDRLLGMLDAALSVYRDEGRTNCDKLVVLTLKMKMECEMLKFTDSPRTSGTSASVSRELPLTHLCRHWSR